MNPTSKNILLSKTFWLQVVALASMLFPPVRAWVESNPVAFVSALGALNVLLRFVTSGEVSFSPPADDKDFPETMDGDGTDDRTAGSGGTMLLLVGSLAGLWSFLPSCSASSMDAVKQVPVQACYIDRAGNTVCYSTVTGVAVTVDRRARK